MLYSSTYHKLNTCIFFAISNLRYEINIAQQLCFEISCSYDETGVKML